MKMTIQSTDRFAHINGVSTRVWEGTTEKGVPVCVFVAMIGVPTVHDPEEFTRDLGECVPVSAHGEENAQYAEASAAFVPLAALVGEGDDDN